MENCIAIHKIGKDRYIMIDCEYNKIPLFATTKQTTSSVAFLVLNSLALFCSIELLGKKEYELDWNLKSVTLSNFISTQGIPLVVVKRMTPDGFEVKNIKVRKTILDNSIELGVGI